MNPAGQAIPKIFTDPERMRAANRPKKQRKRKNSFFKYVCLASAAASIIILVFLLVTIIWLGINTLTAQFLTSPPHPDPARAGFFPAVMGSVWLLVLVTFFTLPIGVATAVILEEFVPGNKILKKIHSAVQLNITNLAGVPSVVYGIIGLTIFVSMFGLFGSGNSPAHEIGVKYFDQFYSEADRIFLIPVSAADNPETQPRDGMAVIDSQGEEINLNVIDENTAWPEDKSLSVRTLREHATPGRIQRRSWYYFRIPFGRGVLAGALTLVLVILPIIITASREALRAVPPSLREAALGMGATRWQTVWKITLPSALPGIMTGTILAVSRAVGEAAPLLMIAGIVFISNPPGNIMDDFTAMPLQIYNWAGRPQPEFHDLAASGIIILLSVLLCFNAAAVFIRNKYRKPLS